MNLCTGQWTTEFIVQAFPASSRFQHCSLWDKYFKFRKFNIGLIQSKEYPSVGNSVTKVTIQNIETNSNDSINQNVIKVTVVIILNYGYGINSVE